MPSLISRRAMLGGLLVGAAAMVAAPLIVEPERCPHCGHRALMPDGRCLHCKRMVSRRAYSFGREGRENNPWQCAVILGAMHPIIAGYVLAARRADAIYRALP